MNGSDSVLLARFVLTRARAAGLDPVELARAAGIGSDALDGDPGSIPGQCYPRLWELFERRMESPHVGLLAAERYGMGELGMMDYLLATAPTFGEGLRAAGDFGARLTNSRSMRVVAETDRDLTLAADTGAEGRGSELAAQATFAYLTARARLGSGTPVTPRVVTLRQRAPRHHAPITEFFGTATVEFGADADLLILRRADVDLPQHTANPGLAEVLRRGAATTVLPAPPARAWVDLVVTEFDSLPLDHEALESISLEDMAWRLRISPRTLQRRLAAAGTSWSRELASARRRAAW
ncbi:AraC family transcriptional regulator ligand-binding domain-containing protein [Nocardia terrae]|nr:AraC family transcriptional regulator ligand-binding domain-containing protein [Nocardia terrae]